MIQAKFYQWRPLHIIVALIVISGLAFFLPLTQTQKNEELFNAVVENNMTKADYWVKQGAQTYLLTPAGVPLLSVAIEYQNPVLFKLLAGCRIDYARHYKNGYNLMEHAIDKGNVTIIKLIIKQIETCK